MVAGEGDVGEEDDDVAIEGGAAGLLVGAHAVGGDLDVAVAAEGVQAEGSADGGLGVVALRRGAEGRGGEEECGEGECGARGWDGVVHGREGAGGQTAWLSETA